MRPHQLLHRLLRHQQWEVGVVPFPIQSFLDPDFTPEPTWMPRRKANQFRADPFVHPVGDRHVILYEDFDYRTHVGRISAAEYWENRFTQLATDVLPIPCHLAYPFTLEHDGRWLCIAETHQMNEVSAWELDPTNFKLSRAGTIISGFPAVDSTIFQHEGRWWLACTRQDRRPLEELHLWFADDLFGDWQPHRNNPVKCDVSCSRPAGTPFRDSGELFRPSQDCSERYGGAIAINHVVRLNPSEFVEEVVRRIPPFTSGPYTQGIHTISAGGDITVVDGLRYTFLPGHACRLLRRKLTKMFSRRSVQRLPATAESLNPQSADEEPVA